MEWWREARFGMFIHWGLYSIPAGEWKGKTNYAEWIRHRAEIPLDTYDEFAGQFDPVKFDADEWARMAKEAGMGYVVITSKHHDGFCLWPSELTDFDVGSSPFKRDIMGELKAACDKQGLVFCMYYSIMDWHHPDYLPRRDWETERPTEGADYSRYVTYMKGQLKELIERYDPGVIWFDGEWEKTWTHEMGKDLYEYVRGLKPDIIVNNRVDKGRKGMEGMTSEDKFRGDFGTPEQRIPPTGIPGVDWESCMTMNNEWGFNRKDHAFKSTTELVRSLIDIASKGGNFLLNVGPRADGTFPAESIDRLVGIGQWMGVNGESIRGTTASPVGSVPWGRVTAKVGDESSRLYLHVFDWPADGQLSLSGLANESVSARLIDGESELRVTVGGGKTTIQLPAKQPDAVSTTVVVSVDGPLHVVK
jgi:alpha-L-fucosidase